jgi:hypothetical protein
MPTATSLPLPNLDDRRWVDLVEEGRALIPFYAPEWTDHNIHDPGITLIELFAWLAEMDLFELNQITDAHRRKFLALAGIAPRSPQSARALLALTLANGQAPLPLAAGLEFEGTDPYAATVPFRSTHGLTVVPGEVAAVLSTTGGTFENLTNAWKRGEPIQPFGTDPDLGSAFYLAIKLPAMWPAGTTISLGFALADLDLAAGARERSRIIEEATGVARDCEPIDDTGCCLSLSKPESDDGDGHTDVPAIAELAHHDVRLIWEVLVGDNRWTRLTPGETVQDGTRGFSLPGRVEITLPEATVTGTLGGLPQPHAWLRVRIARGRHDAAPALHALAINAVEAEQAVPGVTHLRIAPGIPMPDEPGPVGQLINLDLDLNPQGMVTRITFGAALPDRPSVRLLAYSRAASTVSFEAAALAGGTGAPSQELVALNPPLVAESINVVSVEGPTWHRWQVRPDFEASTRADAHVVIEAINGVITTGDGERGRTAPAGATLLGTADVTRAQGGNLAAGKIDRIADSPRNRAFFADLVPPDVRLAKITNVVSATGGAAAETIASATTRARADRERPQRAVTLEDHIRLAKETPGARIARAEARANFHPGFPCLTAPGIVTLLILPYLPEGRPEPTAGLRRLVASYVNRRRVIGTRVEVAGPVYVPVRVRADVESRPEWRGNELSISISEALDRFFHPLTGGPAGTGWPFGRDVFRSEMLQLIDEVPGVAHVLSLELIKDDEPPSCGNLCLGPTGLVDAGMHEITVTIGSGSVR